MHLLGFVLSFKLFYGGFMVSDFLDFEDINVKPRFKEKYKGVPGEKHRIGILWPKNTEVKKGPFVLRNTHYHEKYFVCKDGICCEKLGPSKSRIACLVIKYKTKKDGSLIQKQDKVPFDFEILE